MVRVLQLYSIGRNAPGLGPADLTRLLSEHLKGQIAALALRIGRGGEFRNAAEAAIRLRLSREFNLIHAWDAPAMMASIASGLPVIYNVSSVFSRGTCSWLAAMAYPEV
jgi:hypothetical protein